VNRDVTCEVVFVLNVKE